MTPDPKFVKKLTHYDPDLRVIWSLTRECWLIERKVRRGKPSTYFDSPDPDVVRRARDGYIHVGNVPPRELDELVLINLWKSDMWQQGGAKHVNHVLDSYFEDKEVKDARDQKSDYRYLAGEIWDYLAALRRGRVYVPEQVA